MLNLTEKSKIKNFMSDKIMSNAVKNVLREAFLKSQKTTDVQTLAAERMAINLLEEGFKELQKHSNKEKNERENVDNVGL